MSTAGVPRIRGREHARVCRRLLPICPVQQGGWEDGAVVRCVFLVHREQQRVDVPAA